MFPFLPWIYLHNLLSVKEEGLAFSYWDSNLIVIVHFLMRLIHLLSAYYLEVRKLGDGNQLIK